jgi:hypothetical protein
MKIGEIDSLRLDQQEPDHDARDRDGRREDEVGPKDGPGEEAFKGGEGVCVCGRFRARGGLGRLGALGDLHAGECARRYGRKGGVPERASTRAGWRPTTCWRRRTPG